MSYVEQGFPPYKKNDVVQVISGKYKGKSGKILRMLKSSGRVIVEKINVVKRHTKPSQKDPQGGIVEKEAPIHVSKVLPLSAKTGKPVRVSVWLKEGGEKKKPSTKKAKRGSK
ncbi:MAG: 50S ribosomal protein L24 [Oligoflexia bacterium]|nr:50S ribosomal protein L24 [Oligoflexia bacterium]